PPPAAPSLSLPAALPLFRRRCRALGLPCRRAPWAPRLAMVGTAGRGAHRCRTRCQQPVGRASLAQATMSARTSAWWAVPAAAAIARQWRVGDVRGLPEIWRHGATLAGVVLAAARSRPGAVLLVD